MLSEALQQSQNVSEERKPEVKEANLKPGLSELET
jgi:hypothetical protein